jgi:hypothetical protein
MDILNINVITTTNMYEYELEEELACQQIDYGEEPLNHYEETVREIEEANSSLT